LYNIQIDDSNCIHRTVTADAEEGNPENSFGIFRKAVSVPERGTSMVYDLLLIIT